MSLILGTGPYTVPNITCIEAESFMYRLRVTQLDTIPRSTAWIDHASQNSNALPVGVGCNGGMAFE